MFFVTHFFLFHSLDVVPLTTETLVCCFSSKNIIQNICSIPFRGELKDGKFVLCFIFFDWDIRMKSTAERCWQLDLHLISFSLQCLHWDSYTRAISSYADADFHLNIRNKTRQSSTMNDESRWHSRETESVKNWRFLFCWRNFSSISTCAIDWNVKAEFMRNSVGREAGELKWNVESQAIYFIKFYFNLLSAIIVVSGIMNWIEIVIQRLIRIVNVAIITKSICRSEAALH